MIISTFNKANEAYLTEDQIAEATWDEIADFLMMFNTRATKDDAPMFNLWSFITDGAEEGRKYKYINGVKQENDFNYIPGTIRRCADNAIGVWGLVLDCDAHLTIEQAVGQVDGLEYVLYTSFRHSAAQDKFRIVLPFTRMMTKDEFLSKREDIRKCFSLVDTASFSQSQAIYLHSGADAAQAIAIRGHGAMIDPDAFNAAIKLPPAATTMQPLTSTQKCAYAASVQKSLLTCKGVNRSGNNEGILLASICRSSGLSFNDFQHICAVAARADSSLRTEDVQKQFWNVVGADCKVRKETRDNFIVTHGGTVSISIPTPRTIKIQEIAFDKNRNAKIEELKKELGKWNK